MQVCQTGLEVQLRIHVQHRVDFFNLSVRPCVTVNAPVGDSCSVMPLTLGSLLKIFLSQQAVQIPVSFPHGRLGTRIAA